MTSRVEEMKGSFKDLGLSEELLKAVGSMGFEEPTPIQRKAVPEILAKKDVVGQAQTGTGKTAAFGMPIIEDIDPSSGTVQALVVTPTRELAVQVAEEMNAIGRYKGLHALPVYGGTSIERQVKHLERGVRVVVGTPGRLLDHLRRGTLSLDNVRTVVLDEADEMLDMGFIDDITNILRRTPKDRQTLLFSATMPPEILKISKKYMNDPVKVRIQSKSLAASKVDQVFYEVGPSEKVEALSRLIDIEDDGVFLVFCQTKNETAEVADQLRLKGYDADAIHGDLDQFQREAVLMRFKDEKIDVLTATDVAARGLDISNISHVVNYSIPQNPEAYVHRIGRTGRAGRTGVAVTFVTPKERRQLKLISRASKTRIQKRTLPTLEEVKGSRLDSIREKCNEFIDDDRFDEFLEMARELTTDMDPTYAVASLLKFQLEGFADLTSSSGPAELDYTGAPPGKARLFMTLGREQGLGRREIAEAISEKAGLPMGSIRDIRIFDSFSFVEVPRDSAESVIDAMHRTVVSGRKIAVAPARPKGGLARARR